MKFLATAVSVAAVAAFTLPEGLDTDAVNFVAVYADEDCDLTATVYQGEFINEVPVEVSEEEVVEDEERRLQTEVAVPLVLSEKCTNANVGKSVIVRRNNEDETLDAIYVTKAGELADKAANECSPVSTSITDVLAYVKEAAVYSDIACATTALVASGVEYELVAASFTAGPTVASLILACGTTDSEIACNDDGDVSTVESNVAAIATADECLATADSKYFIKVGAAAALEASVFHTNVGCTDALTVVAGVVQLPVAAQSGSLVVCSATVTDKCIESATSLVAQGLTAASCVTLTNVPHDECVAASTIGAGAADASFVVASIFDDNAAVTGAVAAVAAAVFATRM